MVWVIIAAVFGVGYFLFYFITKLTGVYKSILETREGEIAWKWFLPAVKVPLGDDVGFFFLTPKSQLAFIVESEILKNYLDVRIITLDLYPGEMLKRIKIGNERLDNEFIVAQNINARQDEGLFLSKITPEFQDGILQLKDEVRKKQVNRFITIWHPKNSIGFWVTIDNFLVNTILGIMQIDADEFGKILDKCVGLYKTYKKTGPIN